MCENTRTKTQTQYASGKNLHARGNFHATYSNKNWFRWVADRLTLAPGMRLLDVGCGAGWFWANIAGSLPKGLHLTLLDQSPALLTEAGKNVRSTGRFAEIDVIVGDATELPFDAETFDVVTAMHMLYHVPAQSVAMEEAFRVLRPGGTCHVTTNSEENFRAVMTLGNAAYGGPDLDPAAVLFGPEDASNLLQDRFTDIETRVYQDTYAVDHAPDVVAYLTSMPPGNEASDEQLEQLLCLTEAAITAGGGVLNVLRESVLVSGKST